MKRIDDILQHEEFKRQLGIIIEAERTRCFCNHDLEHLMDVARIAWIINLEEGIGLDQELVYATALLHDIGKGRQYAEGIAHEIAGGEIAPQILADCGLSSKDWKDSKPHLNPTKCAVLAKGAGATELILSHLSPLYDKGELLDEARHTFANAVLAEAGAQFRI